ncbi:hypothetical protein DNO_0432 [Dichelobacter nodosus VCS1703A]|uniref:Uncharacterized protein n=1 Tax=Dichelobacter nodosus (strain VCS1703A) TaxID=246195 RepID=A5EVW3_DICNV|nr:hypothetical protein DNO_0432 [Dichelobacter nodosus VCS1703A]
MILKMGLREFMLTVVFKRGENRTTLILFFMRIFYA